jgi:hypothetical protein
MSTTVKVFAGEGKAFIRFSGIQSKNNGNNPVHTMVFHGGQNDGYVLYDNDLNLSEMLFELSGINDSLMDEKTEFIISPLALLVFLGACDAILQGRYEGGWFTASAIQNAFDLAEDSGFEKLCSPIAYLASESICCELTDEIINEVLREMVTDEILDTDEVDELPLYCFTPELRYLPAIFETVCHRLAILKNGEDGISIHYIITTPTGTWGFTITRDSGRVERLDVLKLQELCSFILAD